MITTMIPDRSARNLGLGFPCPLRSWPPPPPPPPFPPLLSLQRAGSNYYSSKRTVLINASESVFWFNLHRLSQSNEMDDLDLIMLHNRKKPEPVPENGRRETMDGNHPGGDPVAIASADAGEKRKRRQERSCSSSTSFDRGSFPLMLAAIAKLHNRRSRSIIKRLLRSHLALISKPLSLRRLVPNGLLALLPSLLASGWDLCSSLVFSSRPYWIEKKVILLLFLKKFIYIYNCPFLSCWSWKGYNLRKLSRCLSHSWDECDFWCVSTSIEEKALPFLPYLVLLTKFHLFSLHSYLIVIHLKLERFLLARIFLSYWISHIWRE